MCGIAGFAGTQPLNEDRIKDALSTMRHRGPDHAAFRSFVLRNGKHLSLLHTRLNIIDLDPRANQPYEFKEKCLAYNGEVYNYVELKKDLVARGRSFQTESDTEVLIQLLDEEGLEGLRKAEGMWAFALFDKKDDSLVFSRDRFGEKPLYLYRSDEGIYFASEVKVIMAMLGRKLDVNHDHLYRYLVNGYKSLYKDPNSFFEGLEEVSAGSVLKINADGTEERLRYWDPYYLPNDDMTYEEAVQGAKDRLIRSMELRLRADVPLAFCMSGGVDSSALISIAKNVFDYDVHGFTITNTDARYEEQEMVNCLVKDLNIKHTSIPVNTSNFLPKLRKLVKQHDAPVYTITYFAQWLLMESIARHGYKISLSGTAADELFTGYFDHHLAYLYEVREEAALFSASKDAWLKHIQPIVRNPHLQNPELFIENPSHREHIYLNADDFAGYLKKDWGEPFKEKAFTESLLRKRMMNEMFHEAVPVILHEDDLNAMSFSIENRSPFLDRELFEFCYSVPSRHLIKDGKAKSILRDSMKGIVPEPILTNRRKVGFNAPIFDYLDINDPKVKDEILAESPIYDHIEREKIESLFKKEQLPNSESKFLFYFLTSKMFLEEFSS